MRAGASSGSRHPDFTPIITCSKDTASGKMKPHTETVQNHLFSSARVFFYEPLVVTQRIDKPLLHGVCSCRGARVRSRCLSPSPKLSPLVVTLPALCAKAGWRSLCRETLWVKGKVLSVLGLRYHLRVSFIFQVSNKFWCLSPGLLLRDNVRIVWLGLKPPFLFSLNHFIHLYFPSALSSLIFNFLS